MIDIAQRNRQIKMTLEQAFGRNKVAVRGGRGTSYGWVYVNIDHTPRNWEVARELTRQAMALLSAAKIEIGSFDSADYGCGKEIRINFNRSEETSR